MEPRLSTSRKWTPLPAEFLTQVQSVFQENFKAQIGAGSTVVEGRIYPQEILVSVGFRQPNSLKQSNFEVSIGYQRNHDNVLKLLHLAVDAAAALFEQFFASENDSEFPIIWQDVKFEGRSLYVQYTTTNSTLEFEADRLLGEQTKNEQMSEPLVQGDWDENEDIRPEHLKAQLGIDPDDDDDGQGSGPH